MSKKLVEFLALLNKLYRANFDNNLVVDVAIRTPNIKTEIIILAAKFLECAEDSLVRLASRDLLSSYFHLVYVIVWRD